MTSQTELNKRIQTAINATRPQTNARSKAMAGVRWALRCEQGYLSWDAGLGQGFEIVREIESATIYDGRDNEDMKRSYAAAVTGLSFSIQMLEDS